MNNVFNLRTFGFKSLWVIVFALALFANHMGDSNIKGDSMTYASISQHILTLHSWLIMHFDGHVYLNKPPLFFWLTAALMKIFGVNLFTVHLVGALCALALSLIVFYWAVRITQSYSFAYLVVFCLNISYVIYKNTRDYRLESLTGFFIIAALVCFWHYTQGRRLRALLGFGLMSGCAVMTKGPLGLLPWAVVIVYLFTPAGKTLRGKRFTYDMLGALVVCVASFIWWYGYISLHTNFIHHFFVGQILDRLAGHRVSHVSYPHASVFHYVYLVLSEYFMYLPFLAIGAYRLYRQKDQKIERHGLTLLAVYTLVSFIVIHPISTRAERYLYEFYIGTAFFSAYGIASLKKLQQVHFVNWIKVISIVYMLFLLTTPLTLSRNSYRALEGFDKLSQSMHLPLVVKNEWLSGYSDRAGVRFFVHHGQSTIPATGNYLAVLSKHYSGPLHYRVMRKTTELLLVMVERNHGGRS